MKVKDLKKLMCKKVKDDDFQDFFENHRQFGTFDTTNASIIATSDSSITRFTFPPGILDSIDSELRETRRPVSSNAADAKISSSLMSTEVELPKGDKAVVNRKKREKKDLVREVLSSLKNTGSFTAGEAPLSRDEQSFGIIPSPRHGQSVRPPKNSPPKPEEGATDPELYKQFGILKDSNHQVQHGIVRKRWETLKADQDRRKSSQKYKPNQQVSQRVSGPKHSSRRKVYSPPALVRQQNGEDPYCGDRSDNRYPYHSGQQQQGTLHEENQKEDLLLANLRQRSYLSRQSEISSGQESATTTDSFNEPILPPSRAQHHYVTKAGPRGESLSKREFERSTSLDSRSNESSVSLGSLATDSESEFYSELGSELNRSTGDSSLDSESRAYYRSIPYDEQSLTSVEMFVDHLLCATRDQLLPIDWIE